MMIAKPIANEQPEADATFLEPIARSLADLADSMMARLPHAIHNAVHEALASGSGQVMASVAVSPNPRVHLFARVGQRDAERTYLSLGSWVRVGDHWEAIPVELPQAPPDPIH